MSVTLKNLTKLRIAGMISDAASKEAASKIKLYFNANPLMITTHKNKNLPKT